MKKLLSVGIACVFAATAVAGLAGCGEAPEIPDESAPAFDSPDATLSLTGPIDKTTERNRISADLFGLFLEDINFAGYALDDNLISNYSFESSTGSKLAGWTASAGVTFSANTADGMFAGKTEFGSVNPTCAKIVTGAEGYLSNSGYTAVPVAVEEGVDYVFSAFIKTGSYNGNIVVQVTDGTQTYAEKTISLSPSNEWVKYQATLTANKTGSSRLSVRVVFQSAGELLLDCVKLETADATLGFKNYLYNAIADLSPAFFRFPGGCVIEGKSDTSYYDWKNSIGAVALSDGTDKVPAFTYTLNNEGAVSTVSTYGEQTTRTYNTDIWSGSDYYEMEYGIGFYEYFLLCESLGAKAIPIVNCGYSCQTQSGVVGTGVVLSGRHGNKVEDFIQDAKDLICFAKGSVNSSDSNEAYWAGVRTSMGHPEPFEMDYIGIGNEQWGDVYYKQYYEKFLEAFKEDGNPIYQAVTPIVGNCTLFQNCENPDAEGGTKTGEAQRYALEYKSSRKIPTVADYGVHDQHYYMNYTDFLANTHLYDNYKRSDENPLEYYDVFVGEYSANMLGIQSPKANDSTTFNVTMNSVLTALSEAAMMTGFERNGDIVKLAAYAPMFGNEYSRNQWAVNMMFFTNTTVTLTPNYYVQQLFMKNAGDYKVTSELTFADAMPQTTYTANNGTKRTLDDIYYVTSTDEETGDVIVKIVNAGSTSLDVNVAFNLSGVANKGIAEVTELVSFAQNTPNNTSTAANPAWFPSSYTIGDFTNGTLGYALQPYSVVAIRIRTK